MFNDEGTRSSKQIQGSSRDGSVKNFIIEDGKLQVEVVGGSMSVNAPVEIDDTIPIKVENTNVQEIETTLVANKENVSNLEPLTILINKKVTSISIANYAEEENITITIGNKSFVIGANIATELIINSNVTSIVISTSSTTDIAVQYIVKGVN